MDMNPSGITAQIMNTIHNLSAQLKIIGLSKDKTSQAVKETLLELLGSISHQVHTLTYDNGSEFAKHKEIDEALEELSRYAERH